MVNFQAIAADYVTKWHDLAISNTGEHYTLSVSLLAISLMLC